MIRNEKGFSLVELMVTMVVFILVIAASSQIFTALLTQFKQQSKIGESNIEEMVGLDILRRDLAGAGFGLPQNMIWKSVPAIYREAAADSNPDIWRGSDLNDGPDANPARGSDPADNSNAPAAFRSLNDVGSESCNDTTCTKIPNTVADVLAIKSANVAFSDGAQRWTYISNRGETNIIKGWGTGSTDNIAAADRVIVLHPNAITKTNDLVLPLVATPPTFYSRFDSIPTEMQPQTNSYLNYVVYGIDSNDNLRMPFNRADYYVKRPASVPSRCAPNTGILYKGVLKQSDGMHTELPLMDCVADFQVDFLLDTTPAPDGFADWPPDDGTMLNNYTAKEIRDRLKEVRVYIVAQEGQKDTNYDFSQGGTREAVSTLETLSSYEPATNAMVNHSRTLTFVNLKIAVGEPEYKYYRWKLYTIVVQPNNLR
jgi:prepilin-type N-terminal cleavage/methylation domain-containing protein